MYATLKVIHLLAVFSWMAGLFYLPRLLVYHAENRQKGELTDVLMVMERRLLKAIMRPAMVVSWIAGLWLAVVGGWLQDGSIWMWLKIVAVVLMTGVHGFLESNVVSFARGTNSKSGVYFRVLNEVPTVLLIVIVVLVVVKPF